MEAKSKRVPRRIPRRVPDLDEVLKYENHRVLKLYRQNYPENKLSAELAFREVLKYLWLTQKHAADNALINDDEDLPKNCVMLMSMREIDQMWHEFILFTREYTEFCQRHFGEYLHHAPNIFENNPTAPEEELSEISKLLPYIAKTLGDETLRIWFASYID